MAAQRRLAPRATLYLAACVLFCFAPTRATCDQLGDPKSTVGHVGALDLLRRDVQQAASAANSAAQAQRTRRRIHISAIHLDRAEFPLGKLLFKATLKLALSELNEQLAADLANVELTLSIRSANTCALQFASAVAAEEYYKRRARLFVVSGCDDAIRGVARLAGNWRVPVMTAAGFGTDLNDKTIYKTLVRVAFSLQAAVEFLFKIMRTHQWRRVNLFVDESDANSLALGGSIEKYAKEFAAADAPLGDHRFELNRIAFDLDTLTRLADADWHATTTTTPVTRTDPQSISNHSTTRATTAGQQANTDRNETSKQDKWPNIVAEQTVRAALRQSSLFSRVSILLIPQHHLRTFLLSAYDENMATGLYTFINMPLLLDTNQLDASGADQPAATGAPAASKQSLAAAGENVFLWRAMSSTRNSQARQAFESLMSIYLRTPTGKAYVYFSNKLTTFASQLYAAGRPTSAPETRLQLNINPYSASFYDCLSIYASALNESLASVRRDELALLANATDADANGPSSSSAAISRLYQRELHAKISDLIRNRKFENMVTGSVAINANGDRETDFTLDDMNQMTGKFQQVIVYRAETRQMERVARIHWSSDPLVGPTSDTVDCNLIGTCVGRPLFSRALVVITLVTVPLAALLGGLFYFVQSRLTLESKLVDYWWRLHMSEIEIVTTRRKHANDGSLVLSATAGPASAGLGTDQSFVSSQAAAAAAAAASGSQGAASSALRSRPAAKMGSSAVESAFATGCDRTTVTRATGDTTAMASSLDVCYGNISLGVYKLSKVALKPIARFHQSRRLMIELRSIKEVNHSNLCRFVGIVVDEGCTAIVSEFCPKGSLREFFNNESMVIDWTFKYSIINDILAGLNYLNGASKLGFHGRLKSSNCLVSARFVVKLADYGPHSLYEQLDACNATPIGADEAAAGKLGDELRQYRKRIWLAPEHMKLNCARAGSMKGDVYSFGLLLYEIITNRLPFWDAQRDDYVLPLKQLYNELRCNGPGEATGPDLAAIETIVSDDQAANRTSIRPLVELMRSCWHLDASKRPSLLVVSAALKKITRGVTSKKLLDNLSTRMEQYTNNLESLVDEKLAALVDEKSKAEELLYQFVPKSIASALKEGQPVEPEAFECVTVFYSDIVGFTSLSSESSPLEVVDFLSELYLCFDETLEQHDIFKVDTIGDAYIVASGLPRRNAGKHVVEIACAALELRERLAQFKIRHKPDRQLEMRVGIHSGPCIAGVVGGLNMPKYCVFGDTLTIGKFMESTGLPMKIHLTEVSKRLLDGVQGFAIEPRTPRISRDGLPFQTYWLERELA